VAPTTVTAAPEVALGPPPDQVISPKGAAAESAAPVDLGFAVAGAGALAGAAVATAVIARRRLRRS
jgi:pantoate kinase